jgi:hypothetical protein
MTPEEKAVIDAAYAWRYALWSTAVAEETASDHLVKAIDVWDISRSHGDGFADALRKLSVRAVNLMAREKLTPMALADLSWEQIVDIRNAGPDTWAAWAIALEETGIGAAWIADMDRWEGFAAARAHVQERRAK